MASPRRVAVDTGALLALASSRDQYHARARATAERLQAAGARLFGHTLVLSEFHGHLLHRVGTGPARSTLTRLLHDTAFEWMDVSIELTQRAMANWLDRFPDQRFSLTDAVTFEIMREGRVTHAFAFDQHFATAGFALL